MISYDKNSLVGGKVTKKSRAYNTGSSPRDIQNRIRQRSQSEDVSNDIIANLTKHIERLEASLDTNPTQVVEKVVVSGYTEEEFDAELVKVLEAEMSKYNKMLKTETGLVKARDAQIVEQEVVIEDLNNKLTSLNSEVVVLKTQLDSANTRIADKDSFIDDLKSRPVQSVTEGVVIDPERPIMDTVVVDPSDEGALGKLEDNITVEDVSITERESITNKVDKLKELLGGLKG